MISRALEKWWFEDFSRTLEIHRVRGGFFQWPGKQAGYEGMISRALEIIWLARGV